MQACQNQNCLGKLSIRSSSCCSEAGSRKILSHGGPAQNSTGAMIASVAHRSARSNESRGRQGFRRQGAAHGSTVAERARPPGANRQAPELEQSTKRMRSGVGIEPKSGDCERKGIACGSLLDLSACALLSRWQTYSATIQRLNKDFAEKISGHQNQPMAPLWSGGRNEF